MLQAQFPAAVAPISTIVIPAALGPRLVRSSSRVLAASHGHGGPEHESPLAKFFIGGGVTVFFEAFLGGHFIEFLKIAKQTSTDSYPTIIRRITAKGLIGTLDGFVPWGLVQCLAKGAVFSWGQAEATILLDKLGGSFMSKETQNILSGGIGGFVQGVVMSPLLLLKTRVMTDPSFRKSGSAWETTRASTAIGLRVIQAEGPAALLKGMPTFAMKRFADWTTRYMFVELVEHMARNGDPKAKLSSGTKMACSVAGGALSALATLPIDVTVAMIQDASKAGQKVSIIEIYRQQLKQGLGHAVQMSTRGLVARVAHVAATTMLMKSVTSFVYDVIYR